MSLALLPAAHVHRLNPNSISHAAATFCATLLVCDASGATAHPRSHLTLDIYLPCSTPLSMIVGQMGTKTYRFPSFLLDLIVHFIWACTFHSMEWMANKSHELPRELTLAADLPPMVLANRIVRT